MSRRPGDLDPELLRAFREAVRAKIARDLAGEDAAAAERKQRVRAAVERGLAQARGEGLLRAAWLFGSYAWGQPGERSDVDLLVEGCRDPLRVASVVGRITGTEVHVVCVEDAPESLRERALTEGVKL
ncbi:MAG: nucleotidyltransferase domain-containing protein [Deltaproteobacteria bacterium]|nr:nucleotidyltransferase domain-containing protein [Deltaproteobacteria bacterium]